jgi:hypothetical protein
MIKHYIIILWCLAFWGGFITGKSAFAGSWNDKPIMCEQKDIALKTLKDNGEVSIATGISATKVRDDEGLSDIPAMIPIQIFVNLKTKTYTIAEYHPSYNSICILAYGDDWNLLGEKS